MPYLSPATIVSAARSLFGTASAYAIDFFALKAEGVSQDASVRVTSTNALTPGLEAIAKQPGGFSQFVADNFERFPNNAQAPGQPSKPQGGSQNYTLYFPIVDKSRFLLRKDDSNRSIIYTHLTGDRGGDPDRGSLDRVFDISQQEQGVDVRLADDYIYWALRFFAGNDEVMQVPLEPLAIWMHRAAPLDEPLDMPELVKRTTQLLDLTAEELHFLFPTSGLDLTEDDWVDAFEEDQYFEALCFGIAPQAVTVPIREDLAGMTNEDLTFRSEALGYRTPVPNPRDEAKALVASGTRNLLFYGPPRTGKSYAAEDVASEYLGIERTQLDQSTAFTRVQFHHAWSYGDFLHKIVPTATEGGAVAFKSQIGPFLAHCQANPTNKSVFLIEEINRAVIAEVLGEVFHLIEADYRGRTMRLAAQSADDEDIELKIPEDLLLLATANNVDRSTLPFDFAFLSRFATIDYPPRFDLAYRVLVDENQWSAEDGERFVIALREAEKHSGYPIGHAYMYALKSPDHVGRWYRTTLRPILRQYLTEYRAEDLERVDRVILEWR